MIYLYWIISMVSFYTIEPGQAPVLHTQVECYSPAMKGDSQKAHQEWAKEVHEKDSAQGLPAPFYPLVKRDTVFQLDSIPYCQ